MRSVGPAVSDVGDGDALAGVMLAKRGEQLLDTGDLLAANRRQDVDVRHTGAGRAAEILADLDE